ncbi:hypothetical protein C366_03819 [Cryptococcus neoformans Tu401-1]|nr:hypothetical protein C366_03819 [Cryptococcus neoformans var. grubii Tu401-1]
MYRILDLPVETSSSQLRKNVKMLYGQLDNDPSMVVHPKCPTKECQNVFIGVVSKDGWDKFFSCHTLQAKLEYIFSLDGVERLVEDQQVLRSRQRQRDEQMERPAYLQDANPGKILRHQLDGSCYQVDDQDVQRERGCLVLTINVSIDWADTSKSRNRSPRSMGPIMCQLADLPNKYRSQYSFAMLMGITPAPNEPPGCLLHRLLLPLAVDLLSAECDGLWIRTPKYPNGEIPLSDARYMLGLEPFAAIGLPLSPSLDAPILGGRTHLVSNVWYELQCWLSNANSFASLSKLRRPPDRLMSRRAGQLSKATQAHIEALEKSIFTVPGHLSAFDLLPNFDKILHAVVDPMHALLEGILPSYVRKWIARALPPRISTIMICNLAYIRPLQIYFCRVLNNHNAAKTLEELMFQSKGGPVSPDRFSQIFLRATTNYHRKLNYIAEDGERVVFQERQATSQTMAAVRHRDADCFVINTAAFHNIDVLLSALPRTLYQPRRILEDLWEVRFTRGEQLKETRKAKSYQRDMVSVEEGQSAEDVINGRGVRERGAKNRRGRGGKGRGGRGRGESNAPSAEVAIGQPLAEQLPRQRPLTRRGGPSYFAT